MDTLHLLIELMAIEERARTCHSRAEAQRCIRKAEQVRSDLWGSKQAVRFSSS
ncbi:MAG: hypothetical protein VXZ59_06080 [Cyanobacteriota bacterium]|nr:hypothetical protein [Cyanobacteriota bacterium]